MKLSRIIWISIFLIFTTLGFAETIFSLGNAQGNVTDTVAVPLNVSNLEDAYSVHINIEYDTNYLLCDGVRFSSIVENNWERPEYNITDDGHILISIYGISNVNITDLLLELDFALLSETSSTAVSFDNVSVNESNAGLSLVNSEIIIENHSPTLLVDDTFTAQEGEIISIPLTAIDPNNESITFSCISDISGYNWTSTSDNSSTFEWQIPYSSAELINLTFQAENQSAYTDIKTVQINIENVFELAIPDTTTNLNSTITIPINVNSVDNMNINSLLIRLSYDTDILQASEIDFTNSLTEVWNSGYLNNHENYTDIALFGTSPLEGTGNLLAVEFDVLGTETSSTYLTIERIVANEEVIDYSVDSGLVYIGNPNPIFTELEVLSSPEGQEVNLLIEASDPLNTDIEFEMLSLLPDNASFQDNGNASALINWQVSYTSVGDYDFSIRATNSNGYLTVYDFTYTITEVNANPFLENPLPQGLVLMNSSTEYGDLDDYFTDYDSDLTYQVSGNSNILYSIDQDNVLTLESWDDWNGVEVLTITATDELGAYTRETLRVVVAGALYINEDFNHEGQAPQDWQVIHEGTTSVPWDISEDSGNYFYKTENSLLRRSNEKLKSPVYDFSSYSNIEVGFYHEFSINTDCEARFQVSNNGITWNDLAVFTDNVEETLVHSDYSQWLDNQNYVQFRWYFSSDSYYSASWLIDDFYVNGALLDTTPPSTITDLTVASTDSTSVELQWTPCQEEFFSRYELLVSYDDTIDEDDLVITNADDLSLNYQETNVATISDLMFDAPVWFFIRGIDVFDNIGQWSESAIAILGNTPSLINPIPSLSGTYFNSRSVEIGITAVDSDLINPLIEYRIDANGNNTYDEEWIQIENLQANDTISVLVNVEYLVDGQELRFEFRAKDFLTDTWTYSGSNNQEGIADDYYLAIDTSPIAIIQNLTVEEITNDLITLAWTIPTEEDFASYKIYYDSSQEIDYNSRVYSADNYPDLLNVNTSTISLPLASTDSLYWYGITALDSLGNESDISQLVVSVNQSDLPVISNLAPQYNEGEFINSRTVTLSCQMYDFFGIDMNSIQYIFDANGNGVYDEEWIPYQASRWNNDAGISSDTIDVAVEVTFDVDASNLRYQFRCNDIHGNGPSYSGSQSSQDIDDDYSLNIDTTPPLDIMLAIVDNVTDNTIQLIWFASDDLNFETYQIYYSETAGVTDQDMLWSSTDDGNLAQAGNEISMTMITGLNPGTEYFFKIRAIDQAGNVSNFTQEVSGTTTSQYKPLSPSNLSLVFQNDQATLTWEPVTINENGDTIDIEEYIIYSSENPVFEANSNTRVGSTSSTSYSHSTLNTPKLFYKVIAVQSNP